MARGALRIYLGAAPGVGKTFAMLNEGRRRAARGTDVVIAYVETHDRPRTREQLGDLEVVPRRVLRHRDAEFEEMDVDAVIARAPRVALVDELAHTNVPGSRNEKRWQDVVEILAAGIDVITTVNVQHLESMNDVVEAITGTKQRETVPDELVRSAEQVELVDATPEALRRRMAHGNIYPAERIDAALNNYFRPGNLAALRELALMWVADQVDEGLQAYRARHGIDRPWETRERVVVALTGAPHGDALVRRAARIAVRSHGELLGVHVRRAEGLADSDPAALGEHRRLLASLGGSYRETSGPDVARALTRFATQQNATQIVIGASHRSRWHQLLNGSVVQDVVRHSGPIDVHVISTPPVEAGARRRRPRTGVGPDARSPFSARRRALAWGIAAIAPALVTTALVELREIWSLGTDLFVYLLLVVLAAAMGGRGPAALAAVGGFVLANWFLVPPVHTWTVDDPEQIFALSVFLAIGLIVGQLVSHSTRLAITAARSRSQAETLAGLAATVGSDDDPLSAATRQVATALGAHGVAVLRTVDGGTAVEVAVGDDPPSDVQPADLVVDLDAETRFVVRGAEVDVDRLVLAAYAGQLAGALERRRLREVSDAAQRVAELNELRAALLAAVSHDLRTPLASIKASASSLRQTDIELAADDRDELLATIEQETDRLTALVTNLLGMSRIQAGVVQLATDHVEVAAVVAQAIRAVDARGHAIEVEVEPALTTRADRALLERVVVNVLDNALKWSPPGAAVTVRAGEHAGRTVLLVIDRGPGVPRSERTRVFEPFQRIGDTPEIAGTGLGLAVARGFVELMGGAIEVDDTPGGGTTMVIALPGDEAVTS